jgi:ADP-ribosylglycohydrolase
LALVKQGMLTWVKQRPKDIGNQTLRALTYHQAHPEARQLPEDPAALGNGAVMRAAAHGILSASPQQAAENAWLEAGLTHPSVLARASSALVAELVAWLIQGVPAPEALAAALSNLGTRDPTAAQELIPLGQFSSSSSGHTVYTTRLALHSLLEAPDFETGLSQVIALGGDTDTNAAVAGALLGARFGSQDIPERWQAQLKSGLPL